MTYNLENGTEFISHGITAITGHYSLAEEQKLQRINESGNQEITGHHSQAEEQEWDRIHKSGN